MGLWSQAAGVQILALLRTACRWPWAGHQPILCLSFPICTMGIVQHLLHHRGVVESSMSLRLTLLALCQAQVGAQNALVAFWRTCSNGGQLRLSLWGSKSSPLKRGRVSLEPTCLLVGLVWGLCLQGGWGVCHQG